MCRGVWEVGEVPWWRCGRDVRGVDRRCGMAVYSLMMRLVERGLARRYKKGGYLIERKAVEKVMAVLREWI